MNNSNPAASVDKSRVDGYVSPMATTASKIRIRPSRYERSDPTNRNETCRMVDDFERNFITLLKRNPIDRRVDQSLSHRLAERTNRCIEAVKRKDLPSSPFGWHRENARVGDGAEDGVSQLDRIAVQMQVTIEPKSKPRPLPPRVEGWMGNFLRKPTRKRILWRSKLYEKESGNREPPERAEQQMDAGVDDFVRWLNGLGAERSTLTKDIVKQLFSSNSADDTSRALNIAPKEIRAVPESVAAEWSLPQMGLENRIAEVHSRNRKWSAKGTGPRIAFGRALPWQLRSVGETLDGGEDVERPDVPEDLMSLKRLFRDICHLRSVKYLVDYLNERPALPRPRFLQEKGLFHRREVVQPVPFYRKILSQKSIEQSIRN
ncbi:AGAP006406-PA-like protein [Anopheles sinensis]|uniref:AGAP006406-PA-like protein n=1 Tax=Anopheles sinensis TaxID=74873 RepID=A0A084VPX3_ANOSI|nr:AGAP006406-PA-like protein [Anopheles sinensis]